MKPMTHTITELIKNDFGKYQRREIKVRLLKHHIVNEHGVKYRRDNGHLVGGRKWRGVYVEITSLDVDTLKPIENSEGAL